MAATGSIRCDVCGKNIGALGECECKEEISVRTMDAQFYREQLRKIIKKCISAGVPSPSQFPRHVCYEIRLEGGVTTIYSIYCEGKFVQIKLDPKWFVSEISNSNLEIAVHHPQQRQDSNTQSEKSSDGGRRNLNGVTQVEEDGQSGNMANQQDEQEQDHTNNCRPTYTLPLRVRVSISGYATLQILCRGLDWQGLLRDIESDMACLKWNFYGQQTRGLARGINHVCDREKIKDTYTESSNYPHTTTGECKRYFEAEGGEAWCCICHDSDARVGESQKMLVLPCGHSYHPICIVKWLGSKNMCPLCRYEVPQSLAQG